MTICPIALAVHCVGCPFVTFCPAKTILGDYDKYPGQEEKAKKAEVEKPDQEPTAE